LIPIEDAGRRPSRTGSFKGAATTPTHDQDDAADDDDEDSLSQNLPGGEELNKDTLASGLGIIVGGGQFHAGDGNGGGGEEGEGELHGCELRCNDFEKDYYGRNEEKEGLVDDRAAWLLVFVCGGGWRHCFGDADFLDLCDLSDLRRN